METHEIIEHMVECGRQMINDEHWGWCNVMTVTGSNIESEHDGY